MGARYITRGLLGALLCGGAVVLASVDLYHLVRTGNCASGGPYVSARPCPEGTGLHVLGLIAAIFAIAPAGGAIFASRGKGVDGLPGVAVIAALTWCYLWVGMGSAAYVAGHGPAAPPQAGGATSVAITFWAIGGVSLLALGYGFRAERSVQSALRRKRIDLARASPPVASAQAATKRPRAPQTPARPVAPAAASPASTDIAQRLRKLEDLKAAAVISAEEYERKRREILKEI